MKATLIDGVLTITAENIPEGLALKAGLGVIVFEHNIDAKGRWKGGLHCPCGRPIINLFPGRCESDQFRCDCNRVIHVNFKLNSISVQDY